MGALGGLVQEEVLDHEELELADGLLGVVQVGLGQQGILADDVHRAGGAGQRALYDLGDDAAGAARRPHAPRLLEARQRLRHVVAVAGQVGRDAAGVAAALHVVLAAQRRDAGARAAHLAGDKREIEQGVSVVDAVDVLGDAHAPDQAGTGERGTRVPAGGLHDVAGGHARHPLGVLERVGLQRPTPGMEALRAPADEGVVGEALVEDHPRHRVEERHVGAGALADPQIGLVAQLDALGIDDDQPGAAAHRAAEAHGDHRVVRRGVGANHHEAARLLVIDVGVRGGARAHRGQHRLHRRRVA